VRQGVARGEKKQATVGHMDIGQAGNYFFNYYYLL
jgi:hypothetical protein